MRAEDAPELLAALMKPGGVAKAAVVYASVESDLGHAPAFADLIEPLSAELLEPSDGNQPMPRLKRVLLPSWNRYGGGSRRRLVLRYLVGQDAEAKR